jgi:hypothetical protein
MNTANGENALVTLTTHIIKKLSNLHIERERKMGVYKPGSACKCNCNPRAIVKEKVIERVIEKELPNPNPENFQIIGWEDHGGEYIIAEIMYPNCENYEGRKICIYEGINHKELTKQKFLDPHFCDDDTHLSPIARFEPTERGREMAQMFVGRLILQKTIDEAHKDASRRTHNFIEGLREK